MTSTTTRMMVMMSKTKTKVTMMMMMTKMRLWVTRGDVCPRLHLRLLHPIRHQSRMFSEKAAITSAPVARGVARAALITHLYT